MSSAHIAAFDLCSAATFVGVVTDSMCHTDHQPMKVSPDERRVRERVGDTSTFKYALADGSRICLLSDQHTPASLAGKRARVAGVLYEKAGIIKVERVEAVRSRAGARLDRRTLRARPARPVRPRVRSAA